MSRLILIEGLPGTGKTTLATRMGALFEADGSSVMCYREGDLHPCDLQWIARVTDSQLASMSDRLRSAWEQSSQSEPFSAIDQRLAGLTWQEDGRHLVAYTKLDFLDREMWNTARSFGEHEVGSGRLSLAEYRDLYLRRWARFAESQAHKDDVVIFECAFFQSHIIELLGYHSQTREQIVTFLRELLETVRTLNPSITYLRTERYRERLMRTADARGGRDVEAGGWLRDVVRWVEASPYGRERGLTGIDGALAFFGERARIEDEALQRLDVPVDIVTPSW